ncbi:MAG: PDZ domain-containing protein, partial [Eubacterium sp.]|nr:PDZ domain-containing protein [Candidatus Colimonas fimequi]
DVEGLGFAIPINTAAEVANQLMEKGYVSGEAYTGMSYQEGYVSGQGGESGGFDEFFGGGQSQQQTAVYIAEVIGKHAKEAGFQPGDMVYAVDDKIISTFDELSTIITTKKPGDKIKYTIVRNGEIKNIKFELEEKGHEEIEQ